MQNSKPNSHSPLETPHPLDLRGSLDALPSRSCRFGRRGKDVIVVCCSEPCLLDCPLSSSLEGHERNWWSAAPEGPNLVELVDLEADHFRDPDLMFVSWTSGPEFNIFGKVTSKHMKSTWSICGVDLQVKKGEIPGVISALTKLGFNWGGCAVEVSVDWFSHYQGMVFRLGTWKRCHWSDRM